MPSKEKIVVTDEFVFFWGGWASQWTKAAFEVGGVTYNCCEQFMMAEKARVFGDEDSLALILKASNPREQKALGRKVTPFDPAAWNSVCRGIVYQANMAKFTQNEELYEQLMATGDREIVEASPRDRIWGIGMGSSNPDAQDRTKWRGKNWLGIALTQVRETLIDQRDEKEAVLDEELELQLKARRETSVVPNK